MKKMNSSFLFSDQFRFIKKQIQKYWLRFRQSLRKHSALIQRIQLTVIYFLATVTLLYNVRSILGEIPEHMAMFIPFTDFALTNPYLQWFGRSEVTYYLYLLTLELVIYRSVIKFSILVKFNILLIYFLEMIFNLLISWWDVLYIRESDFVPLFVDRIALFNFLVFESLLFYLLYVYSYILAMQNKYPRYPGIMQRIPDSVSFWLRLRKKDKKKG